MNLPQAEAEQDSAGTAAFCDRTRIIGNTDINKPTLWRESAAAGAILIEPRLLMCGVSALLGRGRYAAT
jgi:hypothetical protein